MEPVSFKAYLKRDGQEVEVRRFGIDGGASTSMLYLRGKISAMFPSIRNDDFTIFWQDSDMDRIVIGSDEELMEALTSSTVRPLKIYIHDDSGFVAPEQGPSFTDGAGLLHEGITCDGCQGPVNGYRYKCVNCRDFDLCMACEAAGKHPEHVMMRIPAPNCQQWNSKLFRKVRGGPHKFAHWQRRHGCRSSTEEASPRCPRSGPLFSDFGGFMNYLGGFGLPVSEPTAQARASAQATTGTQAQPQAGQASTQTSPPRSEGPGPHPTDYLNNIGQAVAAFLDPLGIDVTFDVRPKASQPQEGEGSASPMTANGSPPTTTPTTSATPTPTPAPPATFVPAPTVSFVPTPVTSATIADPPPPTFVPLLFPPTTTSATPFVPPSSSPFIMVPGGFPAPMTPATAIIPPPATSATSTSGILSSSGERRNSDDWTLLNRESPTRAEEVAMDIDNAGASARPANSVYPELPKPPQSDSSAAFLEKERQDIQEATDRILSMGFNFDRSMLQDHLKKDHCNIALVLEKLLSNPDKK